jgi:hypothetical protein
MFIVVQMQGEIDDRVVGRADGGGQVEFGKLAGDFGEQVSDGVPFAHSLVGHEDAFLRCLTNLGTCEVGEAEEGNKEEVPTYHYLC